MREYSLVARISSRSPQIEPTLPLINIVFLLLIFFMIAGGFLAPLDDGISVPTQTMEVDGVEFAPEDWLYVSSDGRLMFREQTLLFDELPRVIKDGQVVLFADGHLAGRNLTQILLKLDIAGAETVMLITEQGGGQ